MSSTVSHRYESNESGQKSIWLPTELWVDTLKLLSRRQLLRGMQHTCRRLHAIAELPSVHIIRNFRHFLLRLMQNKPEANQHYAELAVSKVDLARHFRLDNQGKFVEEKVDDKKKEEKVEQNSTITTRIFILKPDMLPNLCGEVVKRCKQSIKQAESVSDQRSFLLYFFLEVEVDAMDKDSILPEKFTLENRTSGEVLHLEYRGGRGERDGVDPAQVFYHLRRCPATELANTDKFYRDTFRGKMDRPFGFDFRPPVMDNNGLGTPTLALD